MSEPASDLWSDSYARFQAAISFGAVMVLVGLLRWRSDLLPPAFLLIPLMVGAAIALLRYRGAVILQIAWITYLQFGSPAAPARLGEPSGTLELVDLAIAACLVIHVAASLRFLVRAERLAKPSARQRPKKFGPGEFPPTPMRFPALTADLMQSELTGALIMGILCATVGLVLPQFIPYDPDLELSLRIEPVAVGLLATAWLATFFGLLAAAWTMWLSRRNMTPEVAAVILTDLDWTEFRGDLEPIANRARDAAPASEIAESR
jgi:hypothetical protein